MSGYVTFAELSNSCYTKAQVDAALSSKQNTISDLQTIRSNAQTAVDAIDTYGDIVTHDASDFVQYTGDKAITAKSADFGRESVKTSVNYTICGGYKSTVSGDYSVVVSNQSNLSGNYGGIIGGYQHTVSGNYSVCAGGYKNTV